MSERTESSRDPLWLTIAVALAAVAVQLPIFDRWFALLDEGYILEIADDINRGKVLYRDVNVDAPFPGAFYLLAWWFRLAGTSVLSSRVLAVAGFAAFAVAAFRVSRALLPRAWSLGVLAVLLCYRIWAFPHWHIYSYSLVSATLLAVAVALAFAWLEAGERAAPGARPRRDLLLLLAAGLAAGAAIMSKQDYGVAVGGLLSLALVAVALLRDPRRPPWSQALAPAATFVAGGALVVLPALGWFAWQGALDELVQQAFLVPLSGALEFSYTRLPALSPFFAQDPALRAEIGSYFPSILATLWWGSIGTGYLYRQTAVWDVALKLVYYAPLVATGVASVLWIGGLALQRGRASEATRREDARRLLLLAWALGFLVAFNRPRDWVHLMMVYPPSVVVGAVLLERAVRRLPRPAALALDTAVALPVVLLCGVSVALALDLRRSIDYQLATPRGGVRSDPRNGPIIDDLLSWVDAEVPPGEPLPSYPVQPMLTFLAGREAAGGFHVIWPVQDPSRDDKIVADLERRRPTAIVYSLSQYAHLGSFEKNAGTLFDYLVANYEIARVFSREAHGPLVTVLRRREEPTAGTRLLDLLPADGALSATRWPFAEVMTHRVGESTASAPAFVQVTVPPGGATLETAYGVNPNRWLGLKSGPFRFAVVALTGPSAAGRGERHLLVEEHLDPAREVGDRRWVPASVDLDRFAGQRLLLAFLIDTPVLKDAPGDLAGWADPRLVASEDAPQAPPAEDAAAAARAREGGT